MAEKKDVCSSSPARTSKLQLTAEPPSIEACWIQPRKDIPPPRAKEKPQQDGRRDEIVFRIKAHSHQTLSGAQTNFVHTGPRDPTETEPELCLTVFCRGMGQQQTAAGAGALGTVDLGMA